MRLDVIIITDFIDSLNYLKEKYKNINFEFSNRIEKLNFSYTDILIINKNLKNKMSYFLDKTKEYNFHILEISDISQIDVDLDILIRRFNFNSKITYDNSNHIFEDLKHPVFALKDKEVIYANKYFCKLLSLNNCENINESFNNLYSIFNDNEQNEQISYNEIIINKFKDKKVSFQTNKKKLFFTTQKIYNTQNDSYIILLTNISNEIEYEQKLEKLLYLDNLTSLPNRMNLIKKLQTESLDIKAISILDITSFKEINDFFGHKIGDFILKEIGNIILDIIKNQETLTLYKFPSDTYCITDERDDKKNFISTIQKIISHVYKDAFFVDQHEIDARICAGISFSNKKNKLITADIALQTAKREHKDYIEFFEELDNLQEYEKNMHWTKKLKTALRNDNIEVFYQPIVNNEKMCIQKFECLVRLIDEEGKVVSPFFFLDISKKSNQYKKITRIVIEKAFKKFQNLSYEFSVNVSYEDIEDPTFLAFIKEKIKEYNIKNQLVIEILEDEGIKNYNLLVNFIDEVKAIGCKVAIDDFGSGYSNFEHLLKMNVDYLKIDASLIKNIAKDENSYKITKTIVEFAKNLNLSTIAEFVENKEILDIVKKLNINFSQGYYFSAPIKDPLSLEEIKGL